MPNTITGFNTFTASTKARATEVNQNFSNFRGTILPINESTVTASDGVHDLGSSEHEFANAYLSNNPYVGGVQIEPLPSGGVMAYAGLSAPSGFLICDGSLISRTTYATLYGIIGETYGEGDLSTTFAIPDMQGRFIRGFDNGAGRDPDSSNRSSGMTAFTLTGTVVALTTVVSDFTSIGRMRVGMRTWGVDYPTTTIASIDTAGSSITLSDTATGSTTGADLVFDFGGDYIGSEQTDAFQGFDPVAVTNSFGTADDTAGGEIFYNRGGGTLGSSSDWDIASGSDIYSLGRGYIVEDGINGTPRVTSESRAKNIYQNYIIKY